MASTQAMVNSASANCRRVCMKTTQNFLKLIRSTMAEAIPANTQTGAGRGQVIQIEDGGVGAGLTTTGCTR